MPHTQLFSEEVEILDILARFVASGLNEDEVIIQTSPGNIPTLERKLTNVGQTFKDLGEGRAMVSRSVIKRKSSTGVIDEDCRQISYGTTLGVNATRRLSRLQRGLLRFNNADARLF
jgi:hypothetical protein